jgi:diaminohydroxyphosphoribosylaminopyrimidine deaminase/5-amino-6-(5-phosphoribosylamino)uracil reductase
MSQQRKIDERWMRRAIELSYKCPPSESAYSVGAVIIDANGQEIATGYSRETDPKVHAEESALAKIPTDDPRLKNATIYSTLEPCSQRASRPLACTQLILAAGITRVVIAWREPSLFVENCTGVESLEQHDVNVVEMPELAKEAKGANAHLDLSS